MFWFGAAKKPKSMTVILAVPATLRAACTFASQHLATSLNQLRIIAEDATDSFIVTDLKSLTDYTFQIAAENSAGAGVTGHLCD